MSLLSFQRPGLAHVLTGVPGDPIGSGTYRTAENQLGTFSRSGLTTASFVVTGSVFYAPPATPRIAPSGMLFEPPTTNVVLYSSFLTASQWTATQGGASPPVVTATTGTAPDGSSTATQIVIPPVNGAGNLSVVFQQISAVSGTNYMASGWFKMLSGSCYFFVNRTGAGAGPADYIGVPITSASGSGWVYYSFPVQSAGVLWPEIGYNLSSNAQVGGGGASFYAWGIQIEALPFPTSYVHTDSAAQSRGSDTLTFPPGSATGISPNEGTCTYTVTPTWTGIYNGAGTSGFAWDANICRLGYLLPGSPNIFCFEGQNGLGTNCPAGFVSGMPKTYRCSWSKKAGTLGIFNVTDNTGSVVTNFQGFTPSVSASFLFVNAGQPFYLSNVVFQNGD